MKDANMGRSERMAVLVACALLICLTLIPVIHYQMGERPRTLPLIYD